MSNQHLDRDSFLFGPNGPFIADLHARFLDDPGSVDRELSVLSARKGVHFVIYEPVWDRPVRCTVPDALLETMMSLWRKRIAAHGMVHYRPDGLPARIEAEEIEPFLDDNELPSHDDVLGALRNRA